MKSEMDKLIRRSWTSKKIIYSINFIHTKISPVIIPPAPWSSSFFLLPLERRSFEPTTARPTMITNMPTHWNAFSLRLRTVIVSIPVNTIKAPLNIWNELAEVIPKPMYIIVVDVMSSKAGIKNINLKKKRSNIMR